MQQISWDASLVFWHLKAGSDLTNAEMPVLCIWQCWLLLWYPSTFLGLLSESALHLNRVCGVCFGRGGEWQHARPSCLAVTGVDCGRMQHVNVCVSAVAACQGLNRHPQSTKCWRNLSVLFKSMRVIHLIGWLFNETINWWDYFAFCDGRARNQVP